MLERSKHAILGIGLALALLGCEQRPGDKDPPPTTRPTAVPIRRSQSRPFECLQLLDWDRSPSVASTLRSFWSTVGS